MKLLMESQKIDCNLILMNLKSYYMVREYREESRVEQYKEKLLMGEVGYFVKSSGEIVTSIWATLNKDKESKIV